MTAAQALQPLARNSVKTAAAGADLLRPRHGIVVLIYHRVGAGTGGQMDLDPGVFDRQLDWLCERSRVISLDDALAELSAPGPVLPGVVLTFDDGTDDWVDHVLPRLERRGVPATFYVSTRFVEDGVAFPGDGRPTTWAALAEMASSDLVTIGSHTHHHLLLDRLGPTAVEDELDRSIDLLGSRLGLAAEHFAYPKAVAGSATAEAAVRDRFRSAALAGTRPNTAGADPHRLARSPVQRSDGMAWFRRKALGGMGLEDDLRRAANRLRYRHLSG